MRYGEVISVKHAAVPSLLDQLVSLTGIVDCSVNKKKNLIHILSYYQMKFILSFYVKFYSK